VEFEMGCEWHQRRGNLLPVGTGSLVRIVRPKGFLASNILEFKNYKNGMKLRLLLSDRQCRPLPVDSETYQSGLLTIDHCGAMTLYNGCCNPDPSAIVAPK
jgi:hypothetical protein